MQRGRGVRDAGAQGAAAVMPAEGRKAAGGIHVRGGVSGGRRRLGYDRQRDLFVVVLLEDTRQLLRGVAMLVVVLRTSERHVGVLAAPQGMRTLL